MFYLRFRYSSGLLLLSTIIALGNFCSRAAEVSLPLDPLPQELLLIKAARFAVQHDDFAAAELQLLERSGLSETVASSVLLARRAMTLCGWLQSDGEYGCAKKIAHVALNRLTHAREDNAYDKEERLYWEALLEAWVLDNKVRGLVLLREAKAMSPEDDRVLDLELELSAAIVQFGH